MSSEDQKDTDKEFEKLKKKVGQDLRIDRSDIKKEVENNCVRYHRYLELFTDEKRIYIRLEKMRKVLHQQLYDKYRFHDALRLKHGSEIEIYIQGNPKMNKLIEFINNCKERIAYLEKVMDLFRMRSFSIKNMIDLIKLEAGGFV